MAFNLEEIGSAIFGGKEMYMDLDSGRIFPCWLVSQRIEALPEHCAKLPVHSATFAPYRYIRALLKADSAALEFMQESYSLLETLQAAYPHCDERVYEKLSTEFCEAYSRIILHTRTHSPDEPTAKLPTYEEFHSAICKRFAAEWYAKQRAKTADSTKH